MTIFMYYKNPKLTILMRRFITFLFISFTLSSVVLAQQMTDDQVILCIQDARKLGKTQTQVATELMQRGVTREQMERIKSKSSFSLKDNKTLPGGIGQNRQRTSLLNSPTTTGSVVEENMLFDEPFFDISLFNKEEKKIFGRDMFTNQNLSFEPNSNIATPANYRLGPGDEIIIDIWGDAADVIRQTISPEGSILVEKLGPVYFSGMTIKEANAHARQVFSKIHSSIADNTSQINLILGQNRSIKVSIMGEVLAPGTYTLSSFSSVFHVLYYAGGTNSIGGIRSIQVIRNGKKIADVDVYNYIMNGNTDDDIRLMEDDVILVPPYESLVQIAGKVKRPMSYEMKKGETVTSILDFAGGFTGDAYKQNIRLIRLSGREKQIYNIDEMDFSVFQLLDGDSLRIGAVLNRFENRVEVVGAVYREGMYQINGSVNTVKQLVQKAEGLRGDAFLDHVQLKREREDLTLEMISIDLRAIINGTAVDVPLLRNDVLHIPSIHDLKEKGTLTIHGQIANPGTYPYVEQMTVEDLIIQSGGLLEAASTARIDIARRIKDPKRTESVNVVGEMFSLEFKDGYVIGDKDAFYLSPFDEVYVRESPVYHTQQNVTISGEILYTGNYALSKKNERLSDLVHRAGGLTLDAFAKGARLTRKMDSEEILRKNDALRMAQTAGDSISIKSLDVSSEYSVGINLQSALSNPGSDFDLVLKEGDRLFIPEYTNTVKINGAVMYPNTVLYKKGEGLSYYLSQAGGYSNFAKKRKAYVIYMNGTVSRLKKSDLKAIEPGCEIIIPSKAERKQMTTGEAVNMGTSIASLIAMFIAILRR